MARNFIDETVTEQAAMYALGMLGQSEARAFDRCLAEGMAGYAEELAVFNRVIAEMGLGVEEQAPAASVRDRLLARIADEADQKHRSVRLNEGKWKRFADGVFIKRLFVDHGRGTVTSLVKLEPGARFPRHRHLGIEESIIIEGDCHVNGEVLMPGDYRRAMAGTTDSELTTERGTLFVLIAPLEVEFLEA